MCYYPLARERALLLVAQVCIDPFRPFLHNCARRKDKGACKSLQHGRNIAPSPKPAFRTIPSLAGLIPGTGVDLRGISALEVLRLDSNTTLFLSSSTLHFLFLNCPFLSSISHCSAFFSLPHTFLTHIFRAGLLIPEESRGIKAMERDPGVPLCSATVSCLLNLPCFPHSPLHTPRSLGSPRPDLTAG